MSRFVIIPVYFNLFLTSIIQASRILAVFPTPSISHQVVYRPLIQELVKRGHQVVVVTPDPAFPEGQTPNNLTEIDVHDVSYKIWRDYILSSTSVQKVGIYTQLTYILDALVEISKEQILNQNVQKLIKHKKTYFDLLLLESCLRPTLAYSHFFKAPIILISSFGAIPGNNELVGAPSYPPGLYAGLFRKRLYNLTLWEKVSEFYTSFQIDRLYSIHEEKSNVMLRKIIGPSIPTINELGENVNMIFYNMHPIWYGNRPAPPSVIYTGWLHITSPKELPQELKSYLDSSLNGVIYVSFGTNVSPSLLPSEIIQTMVKVFSQIPYDVLLKWDKDELPGKTKNIRIFKWLPQADLLMHPKIKLFITQAGLQSTDEAINAGVPLIGLPMMADQWFNAEKYAHHKIGLRYDIENLTEESFAKAINTVIMDESYRRNIAKLRALMLDQPQSSLERAVWWTEHVLRHGGARHLRAPAANMSWSQYLELELIFIVLTCLTSIFLLFGVAIYLLNLHRASKVAKVDSRAAVPRQYHQPGGRSFIFGGGTFQSHSSMN